MPEERTPAAEPPVVGVGDGGPTAAEGRPPTAPAPRRRPTMRPALVVVAVAAVIVLGFGLLAAFSPPSSRNPPPSTPVRVAGTPLRAVPAVGALAPIEHPGTPPADIVDALSLPRGAVAHAHRDLNTSSTQYDQQMRFTVRADEADVVDFYKVRLKATGWSVFDTNPVAGQPGAVEVLAQKGGSDGWYWEVGAVVSPTAFTGHGSGGGQTTAFTLRLFQQSDQD